MVNKVNYFLSKFPTKEWSGPAWYSVKLDENKFPEHFRLEDFHPLDLGDSSSTEWEAKDYSKIIKTKYNENKKLMKCYTGLLHSHHNMGAFFSGTDTSTITEMAPEKGFYASLIVSTARDKEFAFGASYLDQYKKPHVIECDDIVVESKKVKAQEDWEKIADKIEKKAENSLQSYQKSRYRPYFNYNQGTMWDTYEYEPEINYSEEEMKKGKDIWSQYKNPKSKLGYRKMLKKMRDLNIYNPYALFGGSSYVRE